MFTHSLQIHHVFLKRGSQRGIDFLWNLFGWKLAICCYSFKRNIHQNKQYLWCCFANKWQSKHLKASSILKPRNITHRWPIHKTRQAGQPDIVFLSVVLGPESPRNLRLFTLWKIGISCLHPKKKLSLKHRVPVKVGNSETFAIRIIFEFFEFLELLKMNDAPMNQNAFGSTKWITFTIFSRYTVIVIIVVSPKMVKGLLSLKGPFKSKSFTKLMTWPFTKTWSSSQIKRTTA